MRDRAFARIARISQRFEARYTPLGRLFGALTIAAAIFATDPSRTTANLLLAALFALHVVSAVLSLRWSPALTVTRRFPARIAAGIPTVYHLVVCNRGSRAQRDLRFRDRLVETFPAADDLAALPDSDGNADNWFDRRMGFRHWHRALQRRRGAILPVLVLDVLPAGASVEIEVPLVPLRRGALEFARVEVQRADPLGLRYTTRQLDAPQRLLVLPRHFPITELGESGSGRSLQSSVAQPGALPGGQEFHALREYRAGDSRRHIHWRASARRGVHVVKQFVDGYRDPLRILLDPYATPRVLDLIVEIAASLVVAASRQPRCGLTLEWLEPGVPTNARDDAMGDPLPLLEALALRTLSTVDSFELAVRRQHFARHATVIFVTGHWGPSRRAFDERLMRMVDRAHTIIAVDGPAPPLGLPAHCTPIRATTRADDLRRFSLARTIRP